jgi:hypothetical protein
MNTRMKNQHRLMIITVVAGLILVALAFLKPSVAEADVVVRARIGSVGVAVSTHSPRGVVVQTGPRSYRYDVRVRPPRPVHGRYIWVPGHYEMIPLKKDLRKVHRVNGAKMGKGKFRRGQFNDVKVVKRHRKAKRHHQYREIWVPGHWERI